MPYYYQILVVWFKISEDEKTKERIEKFALDHDLSLVFPENGRSESARKKVLQLQMQSDGCETNERKRDAFDHSKDEGYLLDGLEWLSQLDKIPFSPNATVDLTEDSDDSDIEVELPPPVELIEVDDDEQEKRPEKTYHNIPPLNSLRTSSSSNSKICIQERKSYISSVTSLNDTERPLSFMALRRQSIMLLEEERRKHEAKRRKSVAVESKSKPRVRSRAVTVDVKSKINLRSPKKSLKLTRECQVSLVRITRLEIEKFKKGKLKISYFLNKYGRLNTKRSNADETAKGNSDKSSPARRKKREGTPPKSQVAKKSASPNTASYPDHTKPNLSLLQVLGKDIIEASASKISIKKRTKSSRTAKVSECNASAKSDSLDILRSSEKSEEEKSIRIVNVDQDGMEWSLSDHQYAHSPWIDPSPNIEGNSLDVINTPNLQPVHNFDDVSESDQIESIDPIVNTDLLEELLGSRASSYLPDVAASMNSSRVSNVSAEEAPPVETPKKRKYTKRAEPKVIERKELPKRNRKKRILDL